MLLYHHCRPLNSIKYGEIKSDPSYADPDFKEAYKWLEKEVGFFPLFLAVGTTEDDIRSSGYDSNWRRVLSEGAEGKKYAKKGEFPNDVLFSFENADGVFIDEVLWYNVLNSGYRNYQITNNERKSLFKKSWPKSRWLRKIREEPHSVQLIASNLYLPNAKRVWVRNQSTKKILESMGFENVEVKRLRVNKF